MALAAINAGLRLLALGSRFVLSIFMARFMTIKDIGVFSLMAGLIGLLPAVAGFGLNFFMGRELVGLSHEAAIALARDRLRVTAISGVICVLILLVAHVSGTIDLPIPVTAAVGICLLELLGFDMQIALLARGRPTVANLSLLFRTGIWVLPFVISAYLYEPLRNINILSWFWLVGLSMCQAFMMVIYRRDLVSFLGEIVSSRRLYLKTVGWRAAKIYLSDLGLAGSIYIDRFIITALVGVSAAGIYFFFASMISAVYVICLTATVQIYQPMLRRAYLTGGFAALDTEVWLRLRTTFIISAIALITSWPALWVVVWFTNKPDLTLAFDMVPILLLTFGIKVISEFFSVALAAAEQDFNYAMFNIASLGITVLLAFTLIPLMGFRGAALAVLIASIAIAAARILNLRAIVKYSRSKEVLK